jgi:hypothetical protein
MAAWRWVMDVRVFVLREIIASVVPSGRRGSGTDPVPPRHGDVKCVRSTGMGARSGMVCDLDGGAGASGSIAQTSGPLFMRSPHYPASGRFCQT